LDTTAHRRSTVTGLWTGERCFSNTVRIRFAGRDTVLGKDDMKLDQFGERDDIWLAS
jgi:hypothetical protein